MSTRERTQIESLTAQDYSWKQHKKAMNQCQIKCLEDDRDFDDFHLTRSEYTEIAIDIASGSHKMGKLLRRKCTLDVKQSDFYKEYQETLIAQLKSKKKRKHAVIVWRNGQYRFFQNVNQALKNRKLVLNDGKSILGALSLIPIKMVCFQSMQNACVTNNNMNNSNDPKCAAGNFNLL